MTLAQLRAVGLGESGVRARVAAGRLHRVHRGVYAVGHSLLSADGRRLAAVLACGPGAVLSHRSAAQLLDLRAGERSAVDVISPTRAGRRRAGIDVHFGRLGAVDVRAVRGIPCTTVARTLVDLANVTGTRELERALDRAELLRLLDAAALADALGRARGRHGAGRLRSLLDARREPVLTRSELEERFLALCDAASLPRPCVNRHVEACGELVEVDFCWPRERLAAETDGYATHAPRAAFERDRRRDRRLAAAGWRVVRFTYADVALRAGEVARTLGGLLAARRDTDLAPAATP